jgi:hypothetical protein
MTGDCPVQLVLHNPEEIECCIRVGIVIDREGVDIPDLLVEPLLGCPDIADTFEQFIEIVSTDALSFPEPLVIHYESFDEVFAQPLSSPPAELRAPVGADAVADGEDHVKVVVEGPVFLAISSSCQVFLDN